MLLLETKQNKTKERIFRGRKVTDPGDKIIVPVPKDRGGGGQPFRGNLCCKFYWLELYFYCKL